jgi:hypothetical protein
VQMREGVSDCRITGLLKPKCLQSLTEPSQTALPFSITPVTRESGFFWEFFNPVSGAQRQRNQLKLSQIPFADDQEYAF